MACLIDLPVEMINLIIDVGLDNDDLLHFRSTCRELRTKSFDSFRDRFFTTRFHMVEAHSLDVLYHISQATNLASSVRSLKISSCHFVQRELDGLMAVGIGKLTDQNNYAKYKQYLDAQSKLYKQGLAAVILSATLKNLTNCRDVSIVVERPPQQPWGRASLRKRINNDVVCGMMERDEDGPHVKDIVHAVLAAIVKSQTPLESFRIVYSGGVDPTIDPSMLLPTCLDAMEPGHPFRWISHLELILDPLRNREGYSQQEYIDDWSRFLAIFQNLISIELGFNIRDKQERFHGIVTRLQFSCLQRFSIDSIDCDKHDLIKLLTNHKRTLRAIKFTSVMLHDDTRPWQSVLQFINDNLQLNELAIVHCGVGYKELVGIFDSESGTFKPKIRMGDGALSLSEFITSFTVEEL